MKENFAEESKFLLDTDLKIILLDHQNNFIEISNFIIILIVQQNYFFDL